MQIKFDLLGIATSKLLTKKNLYIMQKINNETPISFLTVGELKEILSTSGQPADVVQVQTKNPDEYAHGMHGLRTLFDCSHTKAWQLKMGVLKPAIIQHGRKFQIHKQTALRLVAEFQERVNHGNK